MTDPAGTEKAEANSEPESDDATTDIDDDATTGINQEHAEELATADYQSRLEEFDNVETTPVVSVPAPGEAGPVETPKPESG